LCIEKCEAGLLIDPVNKDIKKEPAEALARKKEKHFTYSDIKKELAVALARKKEKDFTYTDIKKELADIKKELAVALARKKDKDDAAKKIEAANAKKLMEESSKGRKVRDAIKERGIVMGQVVLPKQADPTIDKEGHLHWPVLADYPLMTVVFANPTKAEPTIDKEGHIHWPVLAVYPEFAQSDFMADPPEWDPAGRYVQGNLSVYYASEQSKPLEAQGKKKIDSDEDFINSLLSGSDRKGVEDDYARAAK
ncbi:hypothetical protein T484DRAFT_1841545, partial [Baffinella frigidus]